MPLYYVYYRVAPGALAALRTGWARSCAAACRRWPGLRGELLVRQDEARADGCLTLMEVWSWDLKGSDDGLGAEEREAAWLELERTLQANLSTSIEGPRHVERFEPFLD